LFFLYFIFIIIIENKFNEEQQHYLQSKYLLKDLKNRTESYRTKQHLIQVQIQLASNNIQYAYSVTRSNPQIECQCFEFIQ